MAGDEGGSSRRVVKKSRTKKKRTPTATVNKTDPKTQNGLPKLDRDFNTMDKVPSNAPTMAIAPSDYEHIFHEAAQGTPASPASPLPQLQLPPTPATTTQQRAPLAPSPAQPQQQQQQQQQQQLQQLQQQRPRTPTTAPATTTEETDYTQHGTGRYGAEVQVTPDGYTMLGHSAENNPARRVALPPHIVRASNQFSRAALLRVARFLASRAEQPRM